MNSDSGPILLFGIRRAGRVNAPTRLPDKPQEQTV